MKVTLKIELEFESLFNEEREPKTQEDWAEFFNTHLMPEGSILGVDGGGDYQDVVVLSGYSVECTEVY